MRALRCVARQSIDPSHPLAARVDRVRLYQAVVADSHASVSADDVTVLVKAAALGSWYSGRCFFPPTKPCREPSVTTSRSLLSNTFLTHWRTVVRVDTAEQQRRCRTCTAVRRLARGVLQCELSTAAASPPLQLSHHAAASVTDNGLLVTPPPSDVSEYYLANPADVDVDVEDTVADNWQLLSPTSAERVGPTTKQQRHIGRAMRLLTLRLLRVQCVATITIRVCGGRGARWMPVPDHATSHGTAAHKSRGELHYVLRYTAVHSVTDRP